MKPLLLALICATISACDPAWPDPPDPPDGGNQYEKCVSSCVPNDWQCQEACQDKWNDGEPFAC